MEDLVEYEDSNELEHFQSGSDGRYLSAELKR